MVDFLKMSFKTGFNVQKPQLVLDKGRTLIIAYEDDYGGRRWFNLREIYEEFGVWCPGKGGMKVPIEMKANLMHGLNSLNQEA